MLSSEALAQISNKKIDDYKKAYLYSAKDVYIAELEVIGYSYSFS